MKKIKLLVILLCLSSLAWTQTNTFPSSGNVGIGTTNPNVDLEISSSSDTELLIRSGGNYNSAIDFSESGGTTGFQIGQDGAANLFYISGGNPSTTTRHLTIKRTSGDVELSSNLEIGDTKYLYMGSVNDRIKAESGNIGLYPNANLYIGAVKSGGEVKNATFLENGNVGIGTTSPGAKLDVVGGTLWVSQSSNQRLELSQNMNNDGTAIFNNRAAIGDMKFQMSGTDRMTIKRNGNVGIGTTSPSYPLHVKTQSGTNSIFGLEATNFTPQIRMYSGGANIHSRIAFGSGSGTDVKFSIAQISTGSGIGGSITDRLTLNSSGNVGIGTVDPDEPLSIAGDAIIGQDVTTGVSSLLLGSHRSSTKSVAFAYSNDNDKLRIHHIGNASPAGINLINGGNIGIGTTNPSHLLSLKDGSFELYGTGENSGPFGANHYGAIKIYADGNGSKFEGARIEGLRRGGAADQSMSLSFFINSGSSLDEIMRLNNNGNVGIGTIDPLAKLAVDGNIRATEVKLLADISVPDYVFEPDYDLLTLEETKEYIEEHKHLPEIPSAKEIGENGLDVADMNMRLLKKIEELTLYQIDLLERLEAQQEEINELKKKVK